jgi:hypothetical protein
MKYTIKCVIDKKREPDKYVTNEKKNNNKKMAMPSINYFL